VFLLDLKHPHMTATIAIPFVAGCRDRHNAAITA